LPGAKLVHKSCGSDQWVSESMMLIPGKISLTADIAFAPLCPAPREGL